MDVYLQTAFWYGSMRLQAPAVVLLRVWCMDAVGPKPPQCLMYEEARLCNAYWTNASAAIVSIGVESVST
jgi:hypothetical protein